MDMFCRTKSKVALVAFVASVGTDEQGMMEKGLNQPFSPRPVNRFAVTLRAASGMSSIEYEFHGAPFQAERHSLHRRSEGAGDRPNVGPP